MSEGAGSRDARQEAADGDVIDRVRRLVSSFRSLERVIASRLALNPTDSAAMELLGRVGPLTPKRLALQLGVTPAAVTFVVDRLEAAGHVRRAPNPEDRRSTLIEAAPRSTRAAAEVMLPVGRDIHAAFSSLDPVGQAELLAFLDQLATIFTAALDREGERPGDGE